MYFNSTYQNLVVDLSFFFYNEYMFFFTFYYTYYTKMNAKTMMHYYCITLDYLYLILQYCGGFWSEIASVFLSSHLIQYYQFKVNSY